MYISLPLFYTTSPWNFQKLPLFMEEIFLFIVFSLPLIFTLVAASINSHRRYKMFIFSFQRNMCPLFVCLFVCFFISRFSSFSVIRVNVDIKIKSKERIGFVVVIFLSLGVRRFTFETGGCLKCKISPRLTWRGIRTYWRVRTIF